MTFGKCCSHNNNKEIVFQFDTVSKEEREKVSGGKNHLY